MIDTKTTRSRGCVGKRFRFDPGLGASSDDLVRKLRGVRSMIDKEVGLKVSAVSDNKKNTELDVL